MLSIRNGLPQSFVSGLEQDKAGFVWIATRNGLARYDGRQFSVFQHQNNNPATIASNLIISIQKHEEQLWIEYESGEFDRFDPVSEKVTHLVPGKSLQAGSFLRGGWRPDSKGQLWVIDEKNGLVRFDTQTGTTRLYERSRFEGETLWGLTEGSDGKIWVLTEGSISAIDPVTEKVVRYPGPAAFNYFDPDRPARFPAALYRRTDGELMWGDRQNLFFFSPATGRFRVIPFAGQSRRGIVWIRQGADGSVYFERDATVYRYNDKTGVVSVQQKAVAGDDPLQAFLIDRAGLIWMGTNAYGIMLLDLTTPFFPAYPIVDGFGGDVLRSEFGTSIEVLFEWTSEDSRYSASGYHVRSAYDQKGNLWVGLKETIARYDANTRSFVRLPKVPHLTNESGPGAGLKGLTFSPEGEPVVVGYNGNVLRFDPVSGVWEWLLPNGFISDRVGEKVSPRDISMDAGRLWITTEMDGLLVVELKTLRWQQLKYEDKTDGLPTNQLLGICHDPSRPGRLWIGSYSGLIGLDKKNLKMQTFGTEQGLPDQTIYSILPDRSGHIWFGTNKGLCRLDPLTRKIRIFQTRHGLPEDEFNRFHQLLLPEGRMAFGGTEGWTLFDPLGIKDDIFEPSVGLTGLRVNNVEVEPSTGAVLEAPLNTIGELVLPYDLNIVQISFAGLQFNQPDDLVYRYQLTGYDNDWVEAGHNPLATYTKLPPGRYVFRANASNTTGQWSSHIKSLEVIVRPPWWRTWWIYILYALITAGAVWYWLRSVLVRLELRKSVALKQQEARQIHRLSLMKTRFFTNITHDFRTPLTLILSPLDALIEEQINEEQKRKLSSVKRNAGQLLTLINQLLDFSKIEAQALSVNESRGELSVFVENVVKLFAEEAIRKGVSLTFRGEVAGDYWFDAPKLERMLSNLIANALKFTPAGGSVGVTLEAVDSRILIAVADTGAGIVADQLPYIFDRYYQADEQSDTQTQGSGIGLALVKELVTLQNGSVEVTSEIGKGSTFRLLLAYQAAEQLSAELQKLGDEPAGAEVGVVDDDQVLILLVEDNDELAGFIAQSLPERYRVIRASDGREGLQMAQENIPDLIISDVMMPVMDGFELCRQIKTHEHTRHIPLILLTARASLDSRMEGLELGADDYLSKPFYVPELNLRVYNLLERERRLRQRLKEELSQPNERDSGKPAKAVQTDSFLVRIFDIIEQHLDEPETGVTALSEWMNLSRSQLHRKVRAVSGLTVSELIRHYRLNRAADFLREGYTSAEAAFKAGFDSPAYFSKCFRELYGMTPSEFLKGL